MPNKNTFEIKPIRKFIDEEITHFNSNSSSLDHVYYLRGEICIQRQQYYDTSVIGKLKCLNKHFKSLFKISFV